MRVGLVGLGRMGRPMAGRLLDAGLPLTVWARRPESTAPLAARGAAVAASLEELAAGSDALLTCLPRPEDVEAVAGALLKAARPGAVLVEMSTIDVDTSRRIAAAAAAREVDYLDAPVSGGPEGAALGTLTIMVGGDRQALARVRGVLDLLGTHVHHLGPAGSGHLAKLCNQVLTGTAYAAIAEAMVLGVKGGLDPAQLFRVLSTASGRSRALEQAVPRMLGRAFDAAFTADLAAKDLQCALDTARGLGARLRLAGAARQCYEEMRGLGLGDLDQAAVVLPAERLAGITVAGSRVE
jgi:3-hydroxyisobutyrate dehydrogenase-like beta-hydroxyacid dehydrogenase